MLTMLDLSRDDIFANSLDPDEMPYNSISHQDTNCLPERHFWKNKNISNFKNFEQTLHFAADEKFSMCKGIRKFHELQVKVSTSDHKKMISHKQ